MELWNKFKRLLPFLALIILLVSYVVYLRTILIPNGLLADEFIYLSAKHLELGLMDFIFYSPGSFFGHSSLMPGLNHLVFSLSGKSLNAVRVFHISLTIIFPILLYLNDKTWTWLKVWITALWFFHPFVIAQGITLYPEILQVILCGFCYLFWEKEKNLLLSLFLISAILLRETSLIFLVAIFVLNLKEKKTSNYAFIPPFLIFLIHMTLVIKDNAWNPGWMGYESSGFIEETSRFLFTINWMFSAPLGIGFVTLLFAFPLSQVELGKSLKKNIPSFLSFQNFFFLSLFLLIGLLFYFEIRDSTPFNPWKWFHRVGSLGKVSYLLLPLIGIGLLPNQKKPELFYFWACGFSFFLFFFWYQAHSSRDLLPLYGFALLAIGSQSNLSLKNLRLVTVLLLVSAHIVSFTGFEARPFLKNPLSLYSPEQLKETYQREGLFLERVKRIKTTMTLENEFLNYLGNPNLSETPLVFQPEGELFLSLNGKLHDHKIIDKGVSLYLYRRAPSGQK